ncbi:hypothetical protein [Ekhidna sp.]|jgi:hypothetical protein|uniref:hypothetical protein n=1 Tax=Ekhidna sp. TaxID=2608089 RepID=UPI0032EF60C2
MDKEYLSELESWSFNIGYNSLEGTHQWFILLIRYIAQNKISHKDAAYCSEAFKQGQELGNVQMKNIEGMSNDLRSMTEKLQNVFDEIDKTKQ